MATSTSTRATAGTSRRARGSPVRPPEPGARPGQKWSRRDPVRDRDAPVVRDPGDRPDYEARDEPTGRSPARSRRSLSYVGDQGAGSPEPPSEPPASFLRLLLHPRLRRHLRPPRRMPRPAPRGAPAPAESSQAPAGDTPSPGSNADTLLPPLTPSGARGIPSPAPMPGPRPRARQGPGAGRGDDGESKSEPMPPGDPAANAAPPIPDPNSGPPSNETPKDAPPSTPAMNRQQAFPSRPPRRPHPWPRTPRRRCRTQRRRCRAGTGEFARVLASPRRRPCPRTAAPASNPTPPPTQAPAQAPAAQTPEPDPTPKPAAEEAPPASPAPPPMPAAAAAAPPEQLDRVPSLTKTPPTNETPLTDYPAPDSSRGPGSRSPTPAKGGPSRTTSPPPRRASWKPRPAPTSPRRAEEDVVEPVPHVVRRRELLHDLQATLRLRPLLEGALEGEQRHRPRRRQALGGATIRIPLPEEARPQPDRAAPIHPVDRLERDLWPGPRNRPLPGNTRPGVAGPPLLGVRACPAGGRSVRPPCRRSPLDDPIEPIPEVAQPSVAASLPGSQGGDAPGASPTTPWATPTAPTTSSS